MTTKINTLTPHQIKIRHRAIRLMKDAAGANATADVYAELAAAMQARLKADPANGDLYREELRRYAAAVDEYVETADTWQEEAIDLAVEAGLEPEDL